MSDISSEKFLEISKLQPEARFDYMLSRMLEEQALWGLFGKNGWLMLKADDDECLPVWPDQEFARAWEKNDFPDCTPTRIELNDWLTKWLPGMKEARHHVLVFPLSEDEEGIVLDAGEMQECIADEQASK